MLDTLRRELLNLTFSNSLLKLREFKSKGLTIKETSSNDAFQKLVEESKKCIFLSAEAKASNSRTTFFFKTEYSEKELEKRLYNTFSEAKSFIDERGINALYISLGALKWYDDDNSDVELLSPLLLVPVQIIRNVVQGETTFELRYNGEAIEPNYTLERKMEVEFGIELPAFDENISLTEYYKNLNETIKKKKRWEILQNEIRVNLFSFLKLMMYHDLDDARWSKENPPSKNDLIKNLLDNFGNLLPKNESDSSNNEFQLDNLPIDKIDHILDADNSQAEAIDRVFRSKYLVIKGPPGTGKSQTIANIIASCIRQDKTVLFVSEKLAALQVVKNRLDKTGLGSACLELHSYKANRREILASIGQTLAQKTQQNVRDSGELASLDKIRKELNDYYSTLLDPIDASEITPYQAIGEILKIKQSYPDVSFLAATNPKWSRSEIRQREDRIKSACDFVSQNGEIFKSSFLGSGRLQIGLIEADEIKSLTNEIINLLHSIIENSKRLADKTKCEYPINLTGVKQILKTAQFLLINPGINGVNLDLNEKVISQKEIQELFSLGQEFHELKSEYNDKLILDAHNQNFFKAKVVYEANFFKWYRFIYSDFRESKKQLFRVLKIKPPSITEQLELVRALVKKAELVESATALTTVAKNVFIDGSEWNFENDNKWLSRKSSVEFVLDIRVQRNVGKINSGILEKLDIPKETFSDETEILQNNLFDLDHKFGQWLSTLEFDSQTINQFWGDDNPIIEIEKRLLDVLKKFELLNIYCQWNQHKTLLESSGCSKVSEELIKTDNTESHKVYAFWWYSIMTTLLDEAMKTRPGLNQIQLGKKVETFKQTDRYLIESYNRTKIKYDHLGRIPSLETVGEPMGVLRNELSKQRRHLPLRKLLEQAGDMIVRIKPVFMMSPLSVAQFLKPERLKFDFIIFDEASQVKPVEAFGALLRGENVVIVGDDKQLPPSDYFSQVVDQEEVEEDTETSVIEDLESILDLFVTKNAKQTMLQWHYRSKHESLIAVSNREFYDDKLINLPSASAQNDQLGLQFRHYPDTNYAAGKNEKEAQYIIEALRMHSIEFPNPDDCSIGIAAFGIRQKDCIENMLMITRKEDPVFDKYLGMAENAKEPFFVKNLENVQGDERDIIFVSICYGKNPEGRLFKKFGPVNQKGGERRLNVLFTRARLKCVLFSNFTAGDLQIEENDAKGVKVLKAFLDYAQNRRFSTAEKTSKPTDSPFEDSVKAAIEREGFDVHTQIGSAGYFVDLAIPHPNEKGRYIIGIECDGATYHRSGAARERDRIRQTVLEGLGWNIYRIWSTDWFRQPALEKKKLLDYIALLKADLPKQANKNPTISKPILEFKKDETRNWIEKYQQATVSMFGINNKELHLIEDSRLINIVSKVLLIETPVHQDYLKTVITQQIGISRIGNRIDNKFNQVFRLGARQGIWIKRDSFLWANDKQIQKARDRSFLPEKLSQIEWIAPEELQIAIINIVNEAHSIDKIELMKETLKVLNGGIRLTEGIKSVIEKEVNRLLKGKVLNITDNIIQGTK